MDLHRGVAARPDAVGVPCDPPGRGLARGLRGDRPLLPRPPDGPVLPQRLPPADERLGGRGINHQRCGQALSEVFLLRGPTLLRLLLPGRLGGVRPLPRRQGNPNYGDEPLIPRAAPHLFRRVL